MADYNSSFTGPEIDAAIGSVQNKIDKSAIVNNFVTGGATNVASAETVKTLKNETDTLNGSTVKTSGNQAISGNKTFNGELAINGSFVIQAGKTATQPNDAVNDSDIANLKTVKTYALSIDSAGDGISYSTTNKKISVRLASGLQFTADTRAITFDYAAIANKVNPETNDTVLVFNPITALHRRINISAIGVQSFNGRNGAVLPTANDYSDALIQYTRPDVDRKNIQASSDNVKLAIDDLDDLKASKSELTSYATIASLSAYATKANPTFTGTVKTDRGSATAPVLADSANDDTGFYFTSDSANVTIDGLTELTVKRNEVSMKRVLKLGTSSNYLNLDYVSGGLTVTPYVGGSASASTLTFDSVTGKWAFNSTLGVSAPTASGHATTKQYVDDLVAQAASPVPPASVNVPASGSADVLATSAFYPRSLIALVHYYDNTTNNTLVCSLYIVRQPAGTYVASEKSVEKTYGTAPLTFAATYSAGTFKLTATNTAANVIVTKVKIVSVQE